MSVGWGELVLQQPCSSLANLAVASADLKSDAAGRMLTGAVPAPAVREAHSLVRPVALCERQQRGKHEERVRGGVADAPAQRQVHVVAVGEGVAAAPRHGLQRLAYTAGYMAVCVRAQR